MRYKTLEWTVKHQQAKRASLGKLQSLSHPGVQVSAPAFFQEEE